MHGRITVGEGNIKLWQVVASRLERGNKRIQLNLRGVGYIDSSGLAELARTHTTLGRQGGEMKMTGLSPKVQELLETTRLNKVLEIHKDEGSALQSFRPMVSGACG